MHASPPSPDLDGSEPRRSGRERVKTQRMIELEQQEQKEIEEERKREELMQNRARAGVALPSVGILKELFTPLNGPLEGEVKTTTPVVPLSPNEARHAAPVSQVLLSTPQTATSNPLSGAVHSMEQVQQPVPTEANNATSASSSLPILIVPFAPTHTQPSLVSGEEFAQDKFAPPAL